MQRDMNDILIIENITKCFSGIVALDDVSLSVQKSEIRAVIGENGAGKSTLCNIITGLLSPDNGTIEFLGEKVTFTHPADALKKGIRMVYQERNLIDYLNGAQSICLGLEENNMKIFLNEKRNVQMAEDVKRRVGSTVPLDIEVSKLSPAQQQMIEILRALKNEPELLILDEPTASLGHEEISILFDVIRELKKNGVSVIIITHKLDEVYEIADSISIFRNGKHIITDDKNNIPRKDAIAYMIGQDLDQQYPEIVSNSTEEVVLEVKNYSDHAGKLHGINIKAYKGEVLGLYGLVGVGRTEFIQSLFGVAPCKEGEVWLDGEEAPKKYDPDYMIKKGVFLIPEDRKKSGLIMDLLKIRENLSLATFDKFSNKIGFMNKTSEDRLLDTMTSYEGLRLKYGSLDQDVDELSGGNQQKIVLCRWVLKEGMKILLMDEPTQGIDVGVKHDIYLLIRKLASEGVTVIVSSSELFEITGICDRIYLLKDGKVIDELDRYQFDNEKILEVLL